MKMIKKAAIFTALSMASILAFAKDVTITILETSDLHGAIYPYDYATDKEADNGLAKAATIIKEERAKEPNLILVDAGDNLQDNMIQEFRWDKKNPMVAAMNTIGYDAHILGNHEFNFEFKSLMGILPQFNAPVVAANIYKTDGYRFVESYTIKEVDGVKVGIIGLIAPHVNRWEASNPEHYNYMTFTEPVDEIAKVIEEIGDKADVLVCVSHYGLEGEYDSVGFAQISEMFGGKISAFLIGHAHSVVCQKASNGAVIVEPGKKGEYVSKVVITVNDDSGKWVVTGSEGSNIQVTKKNVEPDPDVLKVAKKAHEKSIKLSNTKVGTIAEDMLPSLWWNDLEGIPTAQVQDTAMMDLINMVQLKYANADVSMTALLDTKANLEKGDFRKRDGVKVYKYDNTLFRVKVTGAQLKKIMELQAGDYFNQVKDGDVTISFNPNIRSYAYDMFAGVDYDIDVSAPNGEKIKNVMFKGEPLADDQELWLAINNYRYGVLSSKGLLTTNPDEYTDTTLAIRDLVSDYVASQKKGLKAVCDNNWKIIGFNPDPEQAAKVYAAVKEGKVSLKDDGRAINSYALNYYELKEKGLVD